MQAIMGFIMLAIIVLTIIVAILSVAKYRADNVGDYDHAFDLSETILLIGKIALLAVVIEFILLWIFDYDVLLYHYDSVVKNSGFALVCFVITVAIAVIARKYELLTIHLLASYVLAILVTPIGMIIILTITALSVGFESYEEPTKSAEDILIEMRLEEELEKRRRIEEWKEEKRKMYDTLERELRNIRDKL